MATTGLEYSTFDVFTDDQFAGNPLAIIRIPQSTTLSQDQKQIIAREFNYSESVFLHAPGPNSPENEWKIDIFLTKAEVPFAGHPTIGTACALGGMFPELRTGTLITKAGPIPITLDRSDDGDCKATASIPHNVHVHEGKFSREQLLKLQPALESAEQLLDAAGSSVVSIVKGMTFVLVKLDSVAILEKAAQFQTPTSSLVELDSEWAPSFIGVYFYVIHEYSTAEKLRISCRMIEQGLEDPATGSAASALASFLAIEATKEGRRSGNSVEFEIEQGVHMGRKSVIGVEVVFNGQGAIDKVLLRGSAVKVMSGSLV